jgi:hypothetical protein
MSENRLFAPTRNFAQSIRLALTYRLLAPKLLCRGIDRLASHEYHFLTIPGCSSLPDDIDDLGIVNSFVLDIACARVSFCKRPPPGNALPKIEHARISLTRISKSLTFPVFNVEQPLIEGDELSERDGYGSTLPPAVTSMSCAQASSSTMRTTSTISPLALWL